jgi:hypothetical protein
MVCAKVNTTVVRFFLFERTFGPVLTFKNLCDGSRSTSLSQVLPKFEPFDSSFITFSNAKDYVSTKFYDKLK